MSEETGPKTWNAPEEVYDTLKELIANYHPDLALCADEIAVIFNEKASKRGDAVLAGKSAKANKLLGILGDVDYKFVIHLGHDVWQEYSASQQIALLDHQLCWCRAEEKESDGSYRYYISHPEVAFFKDEVERHGFWRTSGEKPDDDVITDLFGEDDEES